MEEREAGRRIAHWRRRRGLTQVLFADRIGRSKSWVEKVGAGTRGASLPHLEQLRDALQVAAGQVNCRGQARGLIRDLPHRERGKPSLDLSRLGGVQP